MPSIRAIDGGGNDRGTDLPCRDTGIVTVTAPEPPLASPLVRALDTLRLSGAIFFRSELSEPFAFESHPLTFANLLHPGAERLTLFHIVAQGSCWVEADDGERHWANEGDVIVLPYGGRHVIGGDAPVEPVPIVQLMNPLPWDDLPLLRHGGGGDHTELVCGYLYSEDPLFDPAIRALPEAFVVRLPDRAASNWVHASVTYAMEHTVPSNAAGSALTTRLPELVLIDVLRAHLATAPAADHGWLAALDDPVLAAAVALVHAAPEQRWTVAELASRVAVSRSLLDDKFRTLLGVSPIRYLAEWRMHVASDLLATTDLPVTAVARRVGYDSEEAFSRAFKRAHGLSPSHWRTERTTHQVAAVG